MVGRLKVIAPGSSPSSSVYTAEDGDMVSS